MAVVVAVEVELVFREIKGEVLLAPVCSGRPLGAATECCLVTAFGVPRRVEGCVEDGVVLSEVVVIDEYEATGRTCALTCATPPCECMWEG